MGEEQQKIDALVTQAQTGDEKAGDELIGIIEEMLADGIGLPTPRQD